MGAGWVSAIYSGLCQRVNRMRGSQLTGIGTWGWLEQKGLPAKCTL